MKRTITALWGGELGTIDCFIKSNPNIEEFEQKKTSRAITLDRMLQGEAKEVFDQYRTYSNAYAVSLAEQAFTTGFSLAVRLMTESLREEWI